MRCRAVLLLGWACAACASARGGEPHGPVCDARAFGAVGDGKTKDTAALQRAIDACAGTGGSVVLRHGTFRSGMIRLGSRMRFLIEADATLLGTQDDEDYPDTYPATHNTQLKNCRKALVYAEGVKHLVLGGKGTIDGNGDLARWEYPRALHHEYERPMPVFIALSQDVTVEDLTVRDGAMWTLVNLETDDVVIRHVTIHSVLPGNRDGIDVVDCHRVLIEDSTIASEDDAICLKSGASRGLEDVTVRRCHVVQAGIANGLKLGTASYGAFKNVLFQDITIDSADKAAMAVESVDGAAISHIRFERIAVGNVGSPFFILLGDRGDTPHGEAHRVGSVDDVSFQDVTLETTRHDWGSPISGSVIDGRTHPLTHLSFTNVKTTVRGGLGSVPADPAEYAGQYPDPNLWGDLPAFGFFLRHVDGVVFSGSTTRAAASDARPWMTQRDVANLEVR
jgi:polygalacturonase